MNIAFDKIIQRNKAKQPSSPIVKRLREVYKSINKECVSSEVFDLVKFRNSAA